MRHLKVSILDKIKFQINSKITYTKVKYKNYN